MKMLRIDMSEYKTREDLSRLIGAPPGFVGYDEGEGYLFEHMKKYPKTVIVFDEIDKAAADVMNILLQVMEDGRLTSNRGDTVKFNESIIILTTNLGMKDIVIEGGRPHPVSLYPEMEEAVKSGDPEKIKAFIEKMNVSVNNAVKRFFRPEFLNRLDGTLVFNPLPLDSLTKIVQLFLSETMERFRDKQGINLVIGRNDEEKASINRMLAEKGYIAEYGARPMADAVKRHFENPLSTYMTQNIAAIRRGDTITAKFEKGKIVFEHQKREEAQEVEELGERDRAAITGIAERFKERPAEAITIGDLEEIFGFRKEVAIGAGKAIDPSQLTDNFVLTSPDFRSKDKEANAGRKEIVAKAPDEKKKALDGWIKETVRITKRANFESFLYEKDRMVIKDYWESLPESLPDRLKEAQEAGKLVGLAAGQSDGGLCVAIGYNSGFSKFLQRHIFATKYENAEEIEKTAPRALQGFLKAKLELDSLGIETNFDVEEGKTWFWVEVPVEKSAVSVAEAPGVPGETGDSLKNSYGEEALIEPRPGEEKTPVKSPAEPGSPTTVKCELEVSVIPRETGNFVMPFNVAVDKQGNIFVSNEGDWMSVVNSDEKALNRNFGKKGIISGKIERLICAVIDDAGNIIGVNRRRNFSVLNPDGKKLNRYFGNKGLVDYEPLGLSTPVDMVRDKEGNFLVVDARNESLTVLNPDLTLKTGFASSGTIPKETGKFSKPVGIALDNKGNIFVLNDGNGTISVLKPDGSLNTAFGNDGTIPLDFEDLGERKLLEVVKQGIGIDSKGNIYVIISNAEAMIVLNPDGKSRNPAFGDNGIIDQLQGKFKQPRGLAIDKDDTVYVANAAEIGHISVLKFKKPEPPVSASEETPKLTGPLSTAQKVVDFDFKFSGRMLVGDIPFKVHPNGNLIIRDSENRIVFYTPAGKFTCVVPKPVMDTTTLDIRTLPTLYTRKGQIGPGKKGKFEDTGEITFLEILPSGNILTRDSEGKVRLWDKNGVIIKDAFSTERVEKQSWWAILWSGNITVAERGIEVLPDGNILTIDNDSARLWDQGGNLLDALKVDKVIVGAYGATVFPDGEILTSDSDEHARVWTQYGKLRLDLSPGKLNTEMAYYGAARLDDGRYITYDKDGKQTVFSEDGEQTSPRLEGGISSKDAVWKYVISTSIGWIFASGRAWNSSNKYATNLSVSLSPMEIELVMAGAKGMANLPNGNVLTFDSDNRVRIWTSKGDPIATLKIENWFGYNWREFIEAPIILPNGNILGRLRADEDKFEAHAFLWTPDGEPIEGALEGEFITIGGCYSAGVLNNTIICTTDGDSCARLWDLNGKLITTIKEENALIHKYVDLTPDGDVVTLDNKGRIKRWEITSTGDYRLFLRVLATGDIANMPDMPIENFDANRLIKANAECIVDPAASIDKTDDLKEGDIIYFINTNLLEYVFLVTKLLEDGKLGYKVLFARGPREFVPIPGTEKESSIPEDQLRSGRVYRIMDREQFDETRSQAFTDLKRFIATGDMTAVVGIPQDMVQLSKFIRKNAECVYKILFRERLDFLQVGDVIFTRDQDSEDYIISTISEILWPESMREPVFKVNIICRVSPGLKLRWSGNELSEATIIAGDSRIAENGIYRIMTATEAALRGAADIPSAGPDKPEPVKQESKSIPFKLDPDAESKITGPVVNQRSDGEWLLYTDDLLSKFETKERWTPPVEDNSAQMLFTKNTETEIEVTFSGYASPITKTAILDTLETRDKRIVTGHRDGAIRLWNITKNKVYILMKGPGEVKSLEVSPSGNIITSYARAKIEIMNFTAKTIKTYLSTTKDRSEKIRSITPLSEEKIGFNQLIQKERNIGILDTASGEVRILAYPPPALSRSNVFLTLEALLPDGNFVMRRESGSKTRREVSYLVATSRKNDDHQDMGTVGIYRNTKFIGRALTGETLKSVSSLAVLTDKKIVTGHKDGTIRVWDLDAKEVSLFKGHDSKVSSITRYGDNQFISADKEGYVKFWDLSTNTCRALTEHEGLGEKKMETMNDDNVMSASFSPDSLSVKIKIAKPQEAIDKFRDLGLDSDEDVIRGERAVEKIISIRDLGLASTLEVIDITGDPKGVLRIIDFKEALELARANMLYFKGDKWYVFGGGYLPPDESTSDETLRDLTIPEKLAKCLREAALSLTFNKKIVLAFDTKVAAGSNEDPLGRLMEALRELKEDEANAAILNNLVIVPADSKNMPTELAEHIADKNTEVFVFASTESRKDLRNIESQVHSSYIDHKEFHPDAYFPIAEVVVITLADYCESVLGETGIKNRLTIRNKTLNLDELNIESINKEDAKTLVFKLLPNAKRYDKSRLIKSYATLRRLLIAA
ncbi:MAG: AAA family ATPase [Candidatus Omnitrophota bacterium]